MSRCLVIYIDIYIDIYIQKCYNIIEKRSWECSICSIGKGKKNNNKSKEHHHQQQQQTKTF